MEKYITLKGVRVNNLKNIDLTIPRNKLVVVTGVSGSGKSSLAFDTLYAEGQRRYVESLSSYARQFLGNMNKPECDYIKGLPPAIAIDQRVNTRNPRSTVGTGTEIYDYLKMLFARIGRTFSPISGQEVKKHNIEDIIACTKQYSQGTKFVVLSSFNVPEGRTFEKQLEMYLQEGYTRVWHNGDFQRIDDVLQAIEKGDKSQKAEYYYLLIDRLSVDDTKEFFSRLTDSVETAMYEGHGECVLTFLPSQITYHFSNKFEADGIVFTEPNDNLFSFNSPLGVCPQCEGLGKTTGIDEGLVIPNTSLSVYDGCVQCWHGEKMKEWKNAFCHKAQKDNFPIFKPYYDLTKEEKQMLWEGLPCEKHLPQEQRTCIKGFFHFVDENLYKIQYKVMKNRYMGSTVCPTCKGNRLKKEAQWVKINGRSIGDLVNMPIVQLKKWFENLDLTQQEQQIAERPIHEITRRLDFLLDVGLGYLTLNRAGNTLSGGESQRIRLTTSLGSSLVGSLYILDEPSIGLHSRDSARLIKVLKNLVAIGNTVVVVEHDEEIMRAADYIIDVGPDAGRLGGEIVFHGNATHINEDTCKQYPLSHTLAFLTGKDIIEVPSHRRAWNQSIQLKGARMNNLKGIDITFPLNVLTVITGVSGSGKSSLIKGILYPALKRIKGDIADAPGDYHSLIGDINSIEHIEFVDQNPLGKSTRSNPATYVKAYDSIRQLFANQPLAKQMGFSAQYFSFNTDGGRCEECHGAGVINVEMQFMADIVLECESCHGKRFKQDILDVTFEGKNINDVLEMTVSEAIEFFTAHKQTAIVSKLKPLDDVGLGYIKLGQNSSTLSGGENQRVKLASFLSLERAQPTLFIFDEPTTGLHFHDIKRLLAAMDALIKRGHSVIVIEHNMEVIKSADYVIDLGPEGGDKGGQLVFSGTPEGLSQCETSITGKFLHLNENSASVAKQPKKKAATKGRDKAS